jgi:hypothetical protein
MVLVTKAKRPTSIHHKRRVGQHHKQNQPYVKTYWPYLPMALIVGVGLLLSSFWGNVHKNVLGYATDMSVQTLLQDTNGQRHDNSLGNLGLNEQLDEAAQAKASDMATRNYWAHNTPDGATPWTFIMNAGYQYQTAGENLAYGFDSSATALTAWMNSPEHKANILNATYTDVGFGVANAANYQGTGPETIIVAMYASPAPTGSASVPVGPAQNFAPSSGSAAGSTAASTSTSPGATNKTQNVASLAGSSKNVSRIQLISGGNASWSLFAVSTLAVVCLALFFLRHGLLLRRVFVRGEAFIMKHRYFDIGLIVLVVAGFVLTRSAGVIH